MKKIITLLFVIASLSFSFAQNDMRARIEFENAEDAFTSGKYEQSIKHLDETEKLIGKWTPNTSFLRIENFAALTKGFNNVADPYIFPLYNEVKKYLQFMSKQSSDNVPREKFSRVYGIEQSLPESDIKDYYTPEMVLIRKNYKEKNFTAALKDAQKMANSGNVYAMELLGDMYRFGESVPADIQAVQNWYQQAHKKRSEDTALRIKLAGAIFENEKSTKKDYLNELEFLLKAAEKEEPYSFYLLGVAYYEGKGFDVNYRSSNVFFKNEKRNDRFTPKLHEYLTISNYKISSGEDKIDKLLANEGGYFTNDYIMSELYDEKNVITKEINSFNKKAAIYTLGFLASGYATYYGFSKYLEEDFMTEGNGKSELEETLVIVIGVLGVGGIIGFGSGLLTLNFEYNKYNKALLQKINNAPALKISPNVSHFKGNNSYGMKFTLTF